MKFVEQVEDQAYGLLRRSLRGVDGETRDALAIWMYRETNAERSAEPAAWATMVPLRSTNLSGLVRTELPPDGRAGIAVLV